MMCHVEGCGVRATFYISEMLGPHGSDPMLYLPVCDSCATNAEEQGFVARMLKSTA